MITITLIASPQTHPQKVLNSKISAESKMINYKQIFKVMILSKFFIVIWIPAYVLSFSMYVSLDSYSEKM